MGWVRQGSCPPERCKGQCCERVGVWFAPTPETGPFLRTLGTRGIDLIHDQRSGNVLVSIPQRCQWLSSEGLCRLHHDMTPARDMPARPDFCADWPTEPSQLLTHPDCGYSFDWVEDEALSGGR